MMIPLYDQFLPFPTRADRVERGRSRARTAVGNDEKNSVSGWTTSSTKPRTAGPWHHTAAKRRRSPSASSNTRNSSASRTITSLLEHARHGRRPARPRSAAAGRQAKFPPPASGLLALGRTLRNGSIIASLLAEFVERADCWRLRSLAQRLPNEPALPLIDLMLTAESPAVRPHSTPLARLTYSAKAWARPSGYPTLATSGASPDATLAVDLFGGLEEQWEREAGAQDRDGLGRAPPPSPRYRPTGLGPSSKIRSPRDLSTLSAFSPPIAAPRPQAGAASLPGRREVFGLAHGPRERRARAPGARPYILDRSFGYRVSTGEVLASRRGSRPIGRAGDHWWTGRGWTACRRASPSSGASGRMASARWPQPRRDFCSASRAGRPRLPRSPRR